MITKVFLELTNGRTYNIDAEIEETKMGYKITLPDGSGAEIGRDMIKRIEMEKESAQIMAAGEVEPHNNTLTNTARERRKHGRQYDR